MKMKNTAMHTVLTVIYAAISITSSLVYIHAAAPEQSAWEKMPLIERYRIACEQVRFWAFKYRYANGNNLCWPNFGHYNYGQMLNFWIKLRIQLYTELTNKGILK